MKYYLAVDIGASSGRHIVGWINDSGEIESEEMYRFPNGVREENGHLVWDIDSLFQHVKEGIKRSLAKYPSIESMSIDTWGVDYVLLKGKEELRPVYAYRDSRTKEVIDEVHSLISFDRLYEITGSQFQEFNTIYQLYCDKKAGRLEGVTDWLMIPEYLMYRLTGVKKKEYTNASTTGMMDAKTNAFSEEVIKALGLDKALFPRTYKQGHLLGDFLKEVQEEVGGNIPVKFCSTHDTGAAVEGIPMTINAPYISSGTWSLLGIKSDVAITNKKAMEANYSNEYGPNYIRFQKNIMGLWIIQGLAKQMNLPFPTMVDMARESTFEGIYDVNDSCFLSSLDMKNEIKNYFVSRGLVPPEEDKDLIRSTYLSLAYSYKVALDELENITGNKYECLYIVGGGAKNKLLNEMTEKAINRKVIALPIEATALGNLLSQTKGEII